MTEDERIAIVDLADELQVRKQRIFKTLPRLGIQPAQRREASRGNQNVATVSQSEAGAIRSEIRGHWDHPAGNGARSGAAGFPADDVGFFYLIQLEPEHDPGRFKLGFTMDLDGRLQKHRCSAPFARYTGSWPCKRVWERAAPVSCASWKEVLRTLSKSIQLILAELRAANDGGLLNGSRRKNVTTPGLSRQGSR